MYRLAFQTLQKNFALYATYVVMFVVLERFLTINGGAIFVVGAILALYTHRMILLDETYGMGDLFKGHGANKGKPPILAFFLVSGIGLVVFLLLLAVSYYVLFVQISQTRLKGDVQIFLTIFFASIPATLVYGVLLSLLGTVFPATAVGGDKSLKAAWRRGKPSFLSTYIRLATGPFAFGLIGTAIVLWVVGYLETSGVGAGNIAIEILLAVLSYCINFGGILLGVTALSMAYQSAETDMSRGRP